MMIKASVYNLNTHRRGTVLVMVVGVLVMLFIIGSTAIIVARFERKTTEQKEAATNLQFVAEAVQDPLVRQLIQDVVGTDGIPYNRGWYTAMQPDAGDTNPLEDDSDFVGIAGKVLDTMTAQQIAEEIYKNRFRHGDLIMASLEPFRFNNVWYNYSTSWLLDAQPTYPDPPDPQAILRSQPPATRQPMGSALGKPQGDADGDGIPDADASAANISAMFGGGYETYIRVVSHGGMVMIDRLTHDSLLAQVIHPDDAPYHDTPRQLWSGADPLVIDQARDEARLRRRFWLPRNVDMEELSKDPTNIEYKLPVTLGYKAPSGAPSWFADWTPHWWLVEPDVIPNDKEWWQARLTPDTIGTASDTYDRRRLITTMSYDDILRPQREETRLRQYPNPDATDYATPAKPMNYLCSIFPQLYHVINPQPDGSPDPITGLGTLPDYAYGREYNPLGAPPAGALRFNLPDARTPFSLRDVLEVEWNGSQYQESPSYRRAVQLTAYFLSMIQHTSIPGTNNSSTKWLVSGSIPNNIQLRDLYQFEFDEQLSTAAQLAVNTIDFADKDTIPSYFELTYTYEDNSDPMIPPIITMVTKKFVGVEKQPYITEAYAKIVYSPANPPVYNQWESAPSDESIYAVELYNPYDTEIKLDGYVLRDLSSVAGNDIDLLGIKIPARNYVVIANRSDDVVFVPDLDPFVPGANPGVNLIVRGDLRLIDTTSPFTPKTINLSLLESAQMGLGGATPSKIDVDRLIPVTSGVVVGFVDGAWAEGPDTNARLPSDPDGGGPLTIGDDRLVRDSSLQRHKEIPGNQPIYWHFTLSQQVSMPLPFFEDPNNPARLTHIIPVPVPGDGINRPAQHSLLGNFGFNQSLIERAFLGIEYQVEPINSGTHTPIIVLDYDNNGIFSKEGRIPICPFPVVTADRGIDPDTGRTLAFPTTGTLLLITRYAHQKDTDTPVSVEAAKKDHKIITGDLTKTPPILPIERNTDKKIVYINGSPKEIEITWYVENVYDRDLIRRLDNGHMPIFDNEQVCMDKMAGQGRPDVPWGLLVFDYFTALPLEELIRPLPLKTLFPSSSFVDGDRILDLVYPDEYEYVWALFPGYPLVEPVTLPSGTVTVGPKVRGRVNVNFAPWSVLDGMPVAPEGLLTNELWAANLDRTDAAFAGHEKAGWKFVASLTEDINTGTTQFSNLTPAMAQYMVSYREQRPVEGLTTPLIPPHDASGDAPGFVTVGAIADTLTRIPVTVETLQTGASTPDKVTLTETLLALRNHSYLQDASDTNTEVKPYTYLGFLQLAGPLVRLQDWATVKSHVFTVFSTIGDTAEPPVWLRTQVTVDRTNCLYSSDPPRKVAEIPPISYYNAIDDQKE